MLIIFRRLRAPDFLLPLYQKTRSNSLDYSLIKK